MRMRSPSSAPCETELLGSMARTPTFLPCCRSAAVSAPASVLFPAPGGPVMPTVRARAVEAASSSRSSRAAAGRFSMSVAARASARVSPDRMRSFISEAVKLLFQQLASDHHALYLTGAFADGAKLHIAIEFLYGVVFDETIAAVDLQRIVAYADGDL